MKFKVHQRTYSFAWADIEADSKEQALEIAKAANSMDWEPVWKFGGEDDEQIVGIDEMNDEGDEVAQSYHIIDGKIIS